MSLSMGLIAVAISAIGWGSYLVPMKKVKNYDPYFFQFLMGFAIFLSSVIYAFISRHIIFSYYGIIAGVLWSIGNILSILAVKYGGLSRAAPLWMSIGSASSFIVGITLLKESISNIYIASLGIIFLISGVVIISRTKSEESKGIKGLLLAILAGIVFGVYLVPLKLSQHSSQEFLLSMTLGIFLSTFIIWLLLGRKVQQHIVLPGILSGMI